MHIPREADLFHVIDGGLAKFTNKWVKEVCRRLGYCGARTDAGGDAVRGAGDGSSGGSGPDTGA